MALDGGDSMDNRETMMRRKKKKQRGTLKWGVAAGEDKEGDEDVERDTENALPWNKTVVDKNVVAVVDVIVDVVVVERNDE